MSEFASAEAKRFAALGYPPEAVALLGIGHLPGVGFQTAVRLGGRQSVQHLMGLKNTGQFREAIALAGARIPASVLRDDWVSLRRQIWQNGTSLATNLLEKGAKFLFSDESEFPSALQSIPGSMRPNWIYYRGNLSILKLPCLTVVGTRDPTPIGEFLARYAVSVARELGTPVISGLAYGIDHIVHEWCLNLQLPTISVMGTGILSTYPARHSELADRIVHAGGLLLSEYMPDQGPSAENFVWRNRLQAALGRAVIPAEWARKSGTAHTVRFARTLGRPVFGIGVGGVEPAREAGVGDQHFIVPDDHSSFVEALRIVTDIRHSLADQPPVQFDLFGGRR